MALRLSHVTGHRHWYFYVLALVCVGCWNAAVLVLPTAGRVDGDVGPRSPSEHRLINLTDFRYAGQRGSFKVQCDSSFDIVRVCLSVTFVSKLLSSHQISSAFVLAIRLPLSKLAVER